MSVALRNELSRIGDAARKLKNLKQEILDAIETFEREEERVPAIAALDVILETSQAARRLFDRLGVVGVLYDDLLLETGVEFGRATVEKAPDSAQNMHVCVLEGSRRIRFEEVKDGLDMASDARYELVIEGYEKAVKLFSNARRTSA